MSRFARPPVPGMPSRVVDSNGVVRRQDADTRRMRDDQRGHDYANPERERSSGEGELVVGPEIRFKGEISSCDTLIVHGHVEAALPARAMRIGQTGEYRGTAEVDEAEIAGVFDGTLTVRRRLIIAAGGKVRGTVRYAQLEVAAGGEIAGDIGVLEQEPETTVAPVAEEAATNHTAADFRARRDVAPEQPATETDSADSENVDGRQTRETADSTV